jgi:hypothetical protein
MEYFGYYFIGAIIWFVLFLLITLVVSLLRGNKEGGSENTKPQVSLLEFTVRWFLLWPLTMPMVIWAASKRMTLWDLWASYQKDRETPKQVGVWKSVRARNRRGWVHMVSVDGGGVVTHLILCHNRASHTVSRVGVFVPLGSQVRIEPEDYKPEAMFDTLGAAQAHVDLDVDFLAECMKRKVE